MQGLLARHTMVDTYSISKDSLVLVYLRLETAVGLTQICNLSLHLLCVDVSDGVCLTVHMYLFLIVVQPFCVGL